MRGSRHHPELKAQALEYLLNGWNASDVAARLGLPRKTVSNWKLALGPEKLAEVRTKKREAFDALVYSLLCSQLETLTAQARAFRDKEWLNEQSAKGIGILYGQLSDRAMRMMEWMGR